MKEKGLCGCFVITRYSIWTQNDPGPQAWRQFNPVSEGESPTNTGELIPVPKQVRRPHPFFAELRRDPSFPVGSVSPKNAWLVQAGSETFIYFPTRRLSCRTKIASFSPFLTNCSLASDSNRVAIHSSLPLHAASNATFTKNRNGQASREKILLLSES